MPKVSMIIACLNGIKTIGKAIESARLQTEKDIEIVVIDDGSTDGTADFVRAMAAKDPRINLIKLEKNVGAASASNIGIAQASGEWIAVLDADDWIEPARMETMLNAAVRHNADVVIDNLLIFDHALNEIIESTRYGAENEVSPLSAETFFRRDNPLRRHAMGYSKPMVKKKFLADHNISYCTDHRFGYDFIFMTEILLNGAKAIIVPGAYYVYVHRISPTTRKQSPASRSQSGHTMILRGCNELLAKYGATMTVAQRAELTRRRDIFQSRVYCQDMLVALHQKKYLEAAKILTSSPFILVLIGVTLAKQEYVRLLGIKRFIMKKSGQPSVVQVAS